jgi:2,3-bisphosphoglycerate-independent phosphoglycerate mutase
MLASHPNPKTREALVSDLARDHGDSMLMLVLDGLGGYRSPDRDSELALARTQNLNQLATTSALGLHDPVGWTITVGSGVGHLALFGYDPLVYHVGRGALIAAGIGFELRPGDVAARVNLCTLAPDGTIVDRRASRIPTTETAEVCRVLNEHGQLENAEFFLIPELDYRALLVLRGEGLEGEVTDTDPQRVGVQPLPARARTPGSGRTVELITELLDRARGLLADRAQGNFLLLRGFDTYRELPGFPERYKLRAAALASYPTYLGVARLLGFPTWQVAGPAEAVEALPSLLRDGMDFIFVHVKTTDAAGEDGDLEGKIAAIEHIDALVPSILDSGVQVVAITGDHSTPTQVATHTWHPVPVLLHGGSAPADGLGRFDEAHCRKGSLGRFPAQELMQQMLAAAGRLATYNA